MSATQPQIVIHVLSAKPDTERSSQARCTVRAGDAKVGQVFWFADASGERRTVTLDGIEEGGRHLLLMLSGSGAGALRGGTYLYSAEEPD